MPQKLILKVEAIKTGMYRFINSIWIKGVVISSTLLNELTGVRKQYAIRCLYKDQSHLKNSQKLSDVTARVNYAWNENLRMQLFNCRFIQFPGSTVEVTFVFWKDQSAKIIQDFCNLVRFSNRCSNNFVFSRAPFSSQVAI